MYPRWAPKRLLLVLIALAVFAFHIATLVPAFVASISTSPAHAKTPAPLSPSTVPTPIALTPKPTVAPTSVPDLPVVTDPSRILGMESDPSVSYPRIPWVRVGYASCGQGKLGGKALESFVQGYHALGIRVLLTICQSSSPSHLYDLASLQDAARSRPDAVQCGNEEMKRDASVSFLYVPPQNFARFYALCEQAVHTVRSDIPVLLGSLDPHVGGIDFQPLLDQVGYLNEMQSAMNSVVRRGGRWDWHTQTLGLIDSWHNGYPDSSVNSLYGLFSFWAGQFRVPLDGGGLGRHLWVVEGTGCFKGCGIDESDKAQVAVSHVLTLVTDVQTAMRYRVPFFYFTGRDFIDQGTYWPIGVLDVHGHPKPVRQDLRMGTVVLGMACGPAHVSVVDQLDLLGRLYSGCTLPGNYSALLQS